MPLSKAPAVAGTAPSIGGMPEVVWINGGLMVVLGFLYLFAKPNVAGRKQSKTMLIVGGVAVAGMLAYLSRSMHIAIAVPMIGLAIAVLVKAVLNLRAISSGTYDGDKAQP